MRDPRGPARRCRKTASVWHKNLEQIAQLILDYRYLILVPLAFVEGPIVAFVVGVLVAAGYFNAFVAYAILILGDLIPDTIAYLVGRYGNPNALVARYGNKLGIGERQIEKVRRMWYGHGFKTVLLSKVAYGLSTPLLISAGMVGLPWKRFFALSISVSVIQYALLMGLGYYFGKSFGLVQTAVETIGLAVTAAILVTAIFYVGSRFLRTRLLAEANDSGPKAS